MPKVCYRATDRARPRWRCVLALINRSATNLQIEAIRIIQRHGPVQRQRTLRKNALTNCFVQGATTLAKGAAAMLDIQEPGDTDLAATSLSVEIMHRTPTRLLLHREHVALIPRDPKALIFPLIGSWVAANARTDMHCLGMQFGFDFVKPGDLPYHEYPPQRKLKLTDFESFGQRVLAPTPGVILAAEGSQQDFAPTLTEVTFPQGLSLDNRKAFLGNYVVLQLDSGECLFLAHLQHGSVRVKEGDRVGEGQMIAAVGNSGNTSGPHLHIEMLDGRPDLSRAGSLGFEQSGLPLGFTRTRTGTTVDDLAAEAVTVPDKETIIAPATADPAARAAGRSARSTGPPSTVQASANLLLGSAVRECLHPD